MRAISSPLLEDNSIQGAQGILINISGSNSLTLHEVHEASLVIQKAAHENANIIFGAVQDDTMKDSLKITVIAAGFKEANKKNSQQRQSVLTRTWKTGPDVSEQPGEPVQQPPNVVHQEKQPMPDPRHDARPDSRHDPRHDSRPDVRREVPADDLDVPTFMRRQA